LENDDIIKDIFETFDIEYTKEWSPLIQKRVSEEINNKKRVAARYSEFDDDTDEEEERQEVEIKEFSLVPLLQEIKNSK
jgi:hypothetical protein